jgi:predicted enzyme related to lactoylglutathione lyase
VTVADAAETGARALAAGGAVLVEPADAGDAGRTVVLADPAGAVVAGWEPRALRGAGLVNRPRSFCWCELATRDTGAAARFYRAVFDWHAEPDEDVRYTEWQLAGRTIAGMVPMTSEWPEEVPAHWLVYFAVDDCDASAARAAELGAVVRAAPSDIPPGRVAVVEDAHGALFGIVALGGTAL